MLAESSAISNGQEWLLVSVEHTGTRFVRDHLAAWGVPLLQAHVDSPVIEERWGTQPAIVTVRDPYMSFLSWSKREGNGHESAILVERFISQWKLLDHLMGTLPETEVITFRVGEYDIRDLATCLGVEYRPPKEVEKVKHPHYITDEWISPNKAKFPTEIQAIARRWGY